MTEKELLYLEDAIGHEKNIISICDDFINNITDTNLSLFISEQIKNHQDIEKQLMDMLKEKAND